MARVRLWLEPTLECSPFCQRPLTALLSSAPAPAPMLAVSRKTDSALKEEPLSPRDSRATPRCNRWSRPLGTQTSPRVFAIVSAPADTHLPSHCAPTHPLQYPAQRHRRRGRRRARSHPQGDDDLQPRVRRHPIVFAFLSAPLDTPAPTLCIGSLANNSICGVTTDFMGTQQGTYTAEGITKLCEGLKGSAVTSLECAAAL